MVLYYCKYSVTDVKHGILLKKKKKERENFILYWSVEASTRIIVSVKYFLNKETVSLFMSNKCLRKEEWQCYDRFKQ